MATSARPKEIEMEPEDIAEWALNHGFRKTGHAAYSAWYGEYEYQMLLRRDVFLINRLHPAGYKENYARLSYEHVWVNEQGVLECLVEAFVRRMWHDDAAPPPWFTEEMIDHAREVMIPTWEERIARYR
jgi:hypothetical protein